MGNRSKRVKGDRLLCGGSSFHKRKVIKRHLINKKNSKFIMEKITITKALAELKMLKNRYTKEVSEVNLIAVNRGSVLENPYSYIKKEDFIKKAESEFKSINDIEERIIKIKTKIDEANSKTTVKIGSLEMTIQEAIVMKNLVTLKKLKLAKMKDSMVSARRTFDTALKKNDEKIEAGCTTSASTSKEDAAKSRKEYTEYVNKAFAVEMVDPLNLSDKIKELEKEIEEFENNVDFALSEINSTTYIEI